MLLVDITEQYEQLFSPPPSALRLLKKAACKAAGNEDCEAYLVVYVERFDRLRTKLGGFFSGLLIVHFYLEAQVFDHAPDFGGRLARCREVAVHKDGVCWIERQWLETAQVMFAASGNADFGAGVQKPEKAEHFQTALRGELVAVL